MNERDLPHKENQSGNTGAQVELPQNLKYFIEQRYMEAFGENTKILGIRKVDGEEGLYKIKIDRGGRGKIQNIRLSFDEDYSEEETI